MMFTVYAPSGITAQTMTQHLQDIEQYVRLFAPEAQVEMLQVFEAAL